MDAALDHGWFVTKHHLFPARQPRPPPTLPPQPPHHHYHAGSACCRLAPAHRFPPYHAIHPSATPYAFSPTSPPRRTPSPPIHIPAFHTRTSGFCRTAFTSNTPARQLHHLQPLFARHHSCNATTSLPAADLTFSSIHPYILLTTHRDVWQRLPTNAAFCPTIPYNTATPLPPPHTAHPTYRCHSYRAAARRAPRSLPRHTAAHSRPGPATPLRVTHAWHTLTVRVCNGTRARLVAGGRDIGRACG